MNQNSRAYYMNLAREAARRYGVPEDLFLSLIQQESNFDPSVVSSAGAIGLAQLMPDTAKELGVNPHNVEENLAGGARYLNQMLGRFPDVSLALAAYNAGPTRVARLGRIPNIEETQNYVKSVLGRLPDGRPANMPLSPNMTPRPVPKKDKPMNLMSYMQNPQALKDKLLERNPATGMNFLTALGVGLDALVHPSARMGQQIRETAAQRAKYDRQNLTAEWFAKQPNGEIYAEMLKMGVPVGQVYQAYLKASQGDYVVVGDALVDRKTGKVIYQGKSGSFGGTITLPDGTVIQGATPPEKQDQANAMTFGSRMTEANKILAQYENVGTDFFQNALNQVPWGFGRTLQSEEFKSFDDARRDFVNAVLRRESGAAIAESEFESAAKLYFPVIGDSQQQIDEKRRRRERAAMLITASSGEQGMAFLAELERERKLINPLYGTEEYEEERKRLEAQQQNTSEGGNVVIE